jgi:uncharacterized protein (UPF0332 family)
LIKGYIQKAEKKAEVAEKLFKSGDYEDAAQTAITEAKEFLSQAKQYLHNSGLI